MPSVSPEIYRSVSLVARYIFAVLALMVLLRTLLQMLSDARERKDQLRNLPGSGLIGEMVVITGNDDLPAGSFLPVPREGSLGFVRSCDLVIPADGVHRVHLDFSWKDGVGLLIAPRSGCTAVVNSALLDHHSPPDSVPMTHGSFLQIGSAVLRLRVYAALDHSGGEFSFRDSPQALQQAAPPGPSPSVPDSYPPVPPPEAIPAPDPTPDVSPRGNTPWREDWGE